METHMELLEQRSPRADAAFPLHLRRYAAMLHRLYGRADERRGMDRCELALGSEFTGAVCLREPESPRQAARFALQAPHHVWLVPPATAPVVRRLLVPIDYSERSAAGLRVAIDLARRVPLAKCLTLHVHFHDLLQVEDWYAARLDRQRMETHAAFMARIDCHGVPVEPLFVEGPSIPAVINRVAQERAVDLVVMTGRQRSRWASFVLASLAGQTLRHSRTAFLMLRCPGAGVGLFQALREKWRRAEGLRFG
jgi:nucleotide-binding universal stress UspA family protein